MLARAAAFLLLWIVLNGTATGALAIGALTAVAAAWVSVRLLPPSMLGLRPLALLALVPHFLWQSLVAGIDVARRAFSPRLRLAPGFVRYRPGLPRGAARNAFTGYTALLPGTVPCGEDGEDVIYHCLDIAQPIGAQLAAEERRLARALKVSGASGNHA